MISAFAFPVNTFSPYGYVVTDNPCDSGLRRATPQARLYLPLFTGTLTPVCASGPSVIRTAADLEHAVDSDRQFYRISSSPLGHYAYRG